VVVVNGKERCHEVGLWAATAEEAKRSDSVFGIRRF
jgi:hypothetical protein